MKILVTGATGFLGSHVADYFNAIGYDVYAIGRNKSKGLDLKSKGINFINIDFTNEESVIDICKGMDYIVHAGALSASWGRYEAFYEANVTGTKNLIKGAVTHRVKRFIHVSTPSIYFRFNEDRGVDGKGVQENQALPDELVNFYAKTKWLAEQEIDKAFENGLPVITIRPRAIFGEGDNALMPNLINVNNKIGVPLFNKGTNLMDVTYVENVVHAINLCLQTDEKNLGKKYNITNGEPVEFNQLLTYMFSKLDKPFKGLRLPYNAVFRIAGLLEWSHKNWLNYKEPTLNKYTVSVLAKTQLLNIDNAVMDLGYKPQVTVWEGIDRYAKWYKSMEGKER